MSDAVYINLNGQPTENKELITGVRFVINFNWPRDHRYIDMPIIFENKLESINNNNVSIQLV